MKNIFKSRLFAGGLFILLSSIINRLIIYSLVPIYTKVLTPSDFGVIGYYQAILLVLQILIGLGLYGVQTRLYHDFKHDKKQVGTLIFNLNFMVFSLGLPVCLVNYYTADFFWQYMVSSQSELTIIKLLPFTALTQALAINNNNFRLVQQQFKKLFVQKVGEAVFVALGILFFLLVKKDGTVSDFEGTLLGTFVYLIVFLPGYWSNFYMKIDFEIIKSSLSLGLPLILHSGVSILVNIGDRFLIKHFLGNSEVGVYTLAYQIGQIMSVVSTSLNQSWQAQFLKNSIDNRSYNPNKEVLLVALANAIVGVCITTGTLIFFDWFFDSRYILVKTITPVIVVSFLINYFYFTNSSVIFLHKQNKVLAGITLATLIVNISINFLLIPRFGILGAAYTAIITMLFRSILTAVIGGKLQTKKIEYSKPATIIFVASLFILGTIFLKSVVAVVMVALMFLIPAKIYFFKLVFEHEDKIAT